MDMWVQQIFAHSDSCCDNISGTTHCLLLLYVRTHVREIGGGRREREGGGEEEEGRKGTME